ncbi:CLUMA_CG003847, isoform A [Clunio marinus]|uniref:CLUMA_CG003847, isoform A n=1 Tax=Clunio marinus TaxID=568069 RepID=A0A1J1HRH3_9DIPT|nr:CLUMA_CG003847, isoform A [Clunio marinus]
MKVSLLFVLVFCVHSSYQQMNRQQTQTHSLSYSESDFNPQQPIYRSTTTEAPETTTKKKGFFSSITGFFKSKDKETTTTTQRPTTTKKTVVVSTVNIPTVLSTTTVKTIPSQTPSRVVPPRDDFPTLPPPRFPTATSPTTPGVPKKKDEFPPLPTQPPSRQPPPPSQGPSIPNAWGKPPGVPGSPSQKPQSFFIVTTPTQRPIVQTSTVSSGPVTDAELLTLSDSLFSKDISNPFKYVTVNYQGRTYSSATTDEASQSLLKIDDKLYTLNTVEKMKMMFNNYEQDTSINEYVSPNERKEEDEFIDAVLGTPVMRHAMNFLTQKGIVTSDPQTHRDLLKTIWFNLYSRGMGKIGSSGFEHVFLSEVKNGTVIGLHNWIYMSEVEKSGDLDYKGWTKKIDLGNKGQIAKVRFTLNSLNKPSNSIFIGTSPELELAIYTVCFELRADKDCRLSYGGKDFNIVTHSYRYRGKNLIGSAYPEI